MKNTERNTKIKTKAHGARGRLSGMLLTLRAVALAVILLLSVLALAACGDDEQPPEAGDYSCAGVYYSPSGPECELDLTDSGKFTLTWGTESYTGSYSYSGGTVTLDFAKDGEEATATYADGVVALTYRGATVRLVRKISYTVKFETSGGTVLPDASVLNGSTVKKPADPERDGCIFVGWYADAEYTRPFTFLSDTVSADITLYARWTEDLGESEYTVSFDTGYEASLEAMPTLGGHIFGAPVPSREGYIFGGWWVSTDNDPERLSYKLTDETVFKKNTTLYAVWHRDGSTKIEAPSVTVTESGVSWSTVDGARSYLLTVTDATGTVVVSRSVSTGSVNVSFADLAAGVYTVKVVANANTGDADSSESYYTYVNRGLDKVSDIFVSADSVLVFGGVEHATKYLITVVCGNPEHCHTELDNGTSKTFSFVNCPMPRDGIRFTVTAVAEGYMSSVSDEFVYKKELAPVGGFVWNESEGCLTWSPVPEAGDYMVSVSVPGSTAEGGYVNIGSTPCIDLRHYSAVSGIRVKVYPVAGGYASPDAAEYTVDKASLATPGGITLSGTTLAWDPVPLASGYEISVGGKVYTSAVSSFDIAATGGDAVDVRVRAMGNVPSAWSDVYTCRADGVGTPVYSNGMLRWDHVIGAEYYEIETDGRVTEIRGANFAKITFTKEGECEIKLRYVSAGKTGEWVSVTVNVYAIVLDTLGGTSLGTCYAAAGDTVSLPRSSKSGYTFVSWYNVPGGPYVNGGELPMQLKVSESATLYAHYTPNKYGITYNYGLGGTGAGLAATVEYERDYTLEVPVANDITLSFGGWFSAPYGKGTQYTDGSGASLAPWSTVGGAEVYAFWIDEALTFTPVKVNGRDAYSVSAGPRISLVTDVTVPESYNGLPVAMVAGNAFAHCPSLRSVSLPETVQMISSIDPFLGCTSLTDIRIYKVEGAGSPRYGSEGGILYENKDGGRALLRMPSGNRGSFTVQGGITEIADGAFYGTALSSVLIPGSVLKIGNDAFGNAASLTSVSFGAGTGELTVGKRAFGGCTALESITLPARLSYIELSKFYVNDKGRFTESGDHAFAGCTALTSVSVGAGSAAYSSADGMIYSHDRSQLLFCPTAAVGAVSVPLGTRSIGAGAFVGCRAITSVTIPNTVTYVGEYAFAYLGIGKVTFGGKGFSSVTVGDNAFLGCESLTDVVLEEGSQISVIGERAFSGCTALTSFTVTSSVTSVRDNAFEGCTALSEIIFAGGKRPLEFGKNVFYGCTALTTVRIPENVSKIPGIFGGCTALTEVIVDEGHPYFVSLGGVVFSRDLTEIVYYPQGKGGAYAIPDTVTVIGAGVFSGNKTLGTLIIPNSVSYIGEEALADTDIGNIFFAGSKCAESLTIARSAFEGARFDGYDLTLPAHTRHIEERAFAEVFYQKIVLNEGLLTLGDYAFYNPSNGNGAALTVPASVTSIGEYCFSGQSIESSYVNVHCFFDVVLTAENSSLESIGDFAFYKNARLTSVNIPDSVKSIGNYAFYECRSLVNLTLGSSLESIGAYAFAASAYTYQVPIGTLTVPASVSVIGARAFERCHSLTSVVFEGTAESADLILGTAYRRSYEKDGVEMFSIERGGVFASCTALGTVALSPNIVALGDHSFAEAGNTLLTVSVPKDSRLATVGAFCFYKSGLESFVIPASVRNLDPIEELGLLYDRLGIGNYAFAATSGKLTSLTFESGSTAYPLTVGYGAFENQSRLEAIELPARLASYRSVTGEVIPPLADGALVFYGATALESVTAEAGGPYKAEGGVLYTADMGELVFCPVSFGGEVLVPPSVRVIQSYAFAGCRDLGGISFIGKSALIHVGDYAFYGCCAIGEITLPSGVVSLGEGAFVNASALRTVTLSKSLVSLDISVFNGCSALESVAVPIGNTAFFSDGGVLYDSAKTTLLLYPMGRTDESYTVLGSTVSIGKRAFASNTSLRAAVLPAALREISAEAFSGCTALGAISIPAAVELIGENAFAYTSALTSVAFASGENKLVIESGAFRSSAIGAVQLPARLVSLGADAFRSSALATLTFESGASFGPCEIGSGAFAETPLVSVTLPSGITSVGDGAFRDTDKLDSVTFGDALTSVGAEAFANSAVRSVYFPQSLSKLGAYAFSGCVRLCEVTFAPGSQLSAIERGTFLGCTSLESFTVPAPVRSIGGAKGSGAFEGCTALSAVYFESEDFCTELGAYAFAGCRALCDISIPMSTGELGAYAFSGCTSLTDAVIHRATVKLGEGIFAGCTALSGVEMGTGADRLPAMMFDGCESLTYIFIPAGITEIGEDCFRGTAIEAFDIAEENRSFVSVSGIVYNSSKTEMIYFPPRLKVDTLVIPKEIVSVKNKLFQHCTSIKEVIFEEGGTAPLSIGAYAFDGCYQLRRVVLPERLVSIGSYAFRECYGLTSVTIPKNVESIGTAAFTGCAKLYEVYNESAIEDIGRQGSLNYINNNYYVGAKVNIYTPTEGASVLEYEGDFVFTTVSGTRRLIGYLGSSNVIELPEGTYEIASYMFYKNTSVKRVIIPSSAILKGEFIFGGCESLEAILVSGSIPESWVEGWNDKATVFGTYTAGEIRYTFVTPSGTEVPEITSKDPIALPTPSLEGYVFMGWYSNAEYTSEAYTDIYYSSEKTTLHARFMSEDEYVETYLRGQSPEYAYATESGRTYTVDIREKGAQNYFMLTVSQGEVWNISTPSGMGYHKLWIYDESGRVIFTYTQASSDSMHDINYDHLFEEGGTYYVGVGYKDTNRKPGTFEVTFTKVD